jgi:hypothetical protein
MIILWSRSDHGQQDAPPPANRVMNNPTEAWKYETIIQIDHHREGIPTWVKNIVKAKNDGTVVPGRNPFYNHYVSMQSRALLEGMLNGTGDSGAIQSYQRLSHRALDR